MPHAQVTSSPTYAKNPQVSSFDKEMTTTAFELIQYSLNTCNEKKEKRNLMR